MRCPADIPPAIWERAEILTDALRHIEDDREFAARVLMASSAPPIAGISPRQAQALTFIRSYIAEHGYSPSLYEIAAGLGLPSRSGAHGLVTRLAQRGLVTFRHNATRSVRPVSMEAH